MDTYINNVICSFLATEIDLRDQVGTMMSMSVGNTSYCVLNIAQTGLGACYYKISSYLQILMIMMING